MSFYDDASLVVIPSAQKTSKLYAVKPTDGSGDLTFTRTGDTATRVNSAGLIEKVRTNLILQSQTFDNASWGKDTTTVTANAEVAPDGTLTADTMTISTDASRVTQGPTIGAGSFTASVYVKIISQTTAGDVRFLGVVDGSVVNVNFTPTNQWARYTATFTAATQITSFQLRGATSGFVGTIAIWGFQLEASDFGATSYIPTTTAAVSVGPVANVPRLDYLGSTCPRLILEPQRINVMTFSESIDNAAWTKRNATITANAVVSPDGYTNADKLAEDSSTSVHDFYQYFLATSGVSYTMSFFAKAAERTFCAATFSSTGLPTGNVFFNLQTGVVVSTPAGITAYMVPYGNGWYRCIMSATATSTQAAYFVYANASNGTTTSYAGTTGSGTYIWGAQVEEGAYATSLIPTLAAAVTRGDETCRKTGISSLIGQTSGSVFIESYVGSGAASMPFWLRKLSGGLYGDLITVQTLNNIPQFEVYTGGVSIVNIIGSTPLSNGFHKFAVAYANNDFVFYVDGVQIGTDSSGTPPTCDELYIDSYIDGGSRNATKKQALLFKTRLTNAELAQLTTL